MLYQRGRQFRRRNPTDHRFLFGIGDPFYAVSEFRIPYLLALFFKIRTLASARLPSGRPTLNINIFRERNEQQSNQDRTTRRVVGISNNRAKIYFAPPGRVPIITGTTCSSKTRRLRTATIDDTDERRQQHNNPKPPVIA
jgi:hypothetical protein